MKYFKRVFLLSLALLFCLTSTCFAGTWYQEPIKTGHTKFFTSGPIEDAYANTDIRFNISAEDSYRFVKVALFEWQYIPKLPSEGGGFQYVQIQENSVHLKPYETGYLVLNTHDEDIKVNGKIKYEITVLFGGPCRFYNGYYSYFIDN